MAFKEVDSRVKFPELEEKTLKYWEEKKIFEKWLKRNNGEEKYVLYDGPPTANGKPHVGHVITRAFKDIYPRFKKMQGYDVLTKAGWDTHGLPVEVLIEKELGLKSKEEIENIVEGDKRASIEKFNNYCKESVFRHVDLWRKLVNRVGHWIDMENAYITYDRNYMESVWWSLSELFNKELLYKDYKVVPYCARCGTPLSSHEVSQEYQETKDNSVYVKFELVDEPNKYLVAWTTTPWTLPGNVALAISKDIGYVEVKDGGQSLIMAKSAAEKMNYKNTTKVKYEDLIGKKYKPLFSYLSDKFDNKDLHSVISADFVTDEDGSGIVHTAVMYGADDFELASEYDLPKHHLINTDGEFTDEVAKFAGKHVKAANPLITRDIKDSGLLLREEEIVHQYPFCWRCHEPLIYYALDAWFIKATDYQKKMIEHNNSVNWVPNHVKKGRMNNWYKTLIDWSISRNRYWGTPLPIWECSKCDHTTAIGSIGDLKAKATNKNIDWEQLDLHRPYVDDIKLKCDKCESQMNRVEEVIDVWYDSGSMPFAQWHYPHENKDIFKENFPADYISEAIDQTRGWFYSLQSISTMIFDKSPYKNVVVFEHVLDPDGKKMSKSKGNVIDPWEVLESAGADATRWFFFSSVAVGTQYRASTEIIRDSARGFLIPLWNVYKFFVMYSNLDDWDQKIVQSDNILDVWINSKFNNLKKSVTELLEGYDAYRSSNLIKDFVVNDFSQWYIRRSRDRTGQEFYSTSQDILVDLAKLLAPYTPFISEEIFRNLTGKDSVHLADWPEFDEKLINLELEKEMSEARKAVELAHAQRKEKQIKVRQPLAKLSLKSEFAFSDEIKKLIAEEVNVLEVESQKGDELEVMLDTELTDELKIMGEAREWTRNIQQERKKIGTNLDEYVDVVLPIKIEEKYLDSLKKKALVNNIEFGDEFSVKRTNE